MMCPIDCGSGCCSGGWYVFSGNDIGAVIGWWIITRFKSLHSDSGKTLLSSTEFLDF